MTAIDLAKRHGGPPLICVVLGTDCIIELGDYCLVFQGLLPIVEVVSVPFGTTEVLVVECGWFVR